MSVKSTSGHAADVVRALGVWPHRDDNEFCEIEVWRCANEFRGGPEWRRDVFHDARDVGVGDDLKLL